MSRSIVPLLLILAVANAGLAQDNTIQIEVKRDKLTAENVPVCVPLSVPAEWARLDEVKVVYGSRLGKFAQETVGQLTTPGIMTESIKPAKTGLVRRDLHVLMNTAGEVDYVMKVNFLKVDPQIPRFAWIEKKGEYEELVLTYSGRLIRCLRYMNRPYDASAPAARDKSYKVFHHLYDPSGTRFVTNGGQTDADVADPKKMLYPHHRGIMYGFNKCMIGPDLKTQADTWHCPPANSKITAHVAHEKTLSSEAGPVLGRHRVQLGWYGAGDKPFAQEERELTVYQGKAGTLVEFASRLKTTGGKIKVDGDPQHAGFQFRAHNAISENGKKETYYLHHDGSKGAMGAERNWPGDKAMVDLPWYVVSFLLDKNRYSVAYLNHPSNPKETRFSERSYARFGGYFEREITEDNPLVVNYRLWMQPGEMTADQAATLQAAFASPPRTSAK